MEDRGQFCRLGGKSAAWLVFGWELACNNSTWTSLPMSLPLKELEFSCGLQTPIFSKKRSDQSDA